MKVYVAGRADTEDSVEKVRRVQQLLRDAGHEITHDWTGSAGKVLEDWTDKDDEASKYAERDRMGVWGAEVLVLCGSDPHGGLGCFIETGMAIAWGVYVVIVEPIRESVFWHLPAVQRCQEYELAAVMEELCPSPM